MALSKLGLRVIEEANNLKRTKKALAEELNIKPSYLEKIINGKCNLKEKQDFIKMMLKKYPIDKTKLENLESEPFHSFTILDKNTSKNSARIFKRKNSLGKINDYYEYRDTAMNKYSPIYPEWIKPLVIVNNNNPRNRLVCYNKGHLLHQFTFFIGEVNFYWKDDLGYHCKVMNTGDSNYIPPFVPHSFSSRNKNKLGLIIAVTFADILRFSRSKFTNYTKKNIEEFSGKKNSKFSYFYLFIKDFINKNFLDENSLIEKMLLNGINKNTAKNIINGKKTPSNQHINKLSKVFSIPYSKLKTMIANETSKVINKNFALSSKKRIFKDKISFNVWYLAKSNYDNFLNTFIMEVDAETKKYEVFHQMHEYVFNYSESEIILKISNKMYVLKPEESAIINPHIKHYFYTKENVKSARLLIIRVGEEFSQDFIHMYAGLSESSRRRIFEEVSQWF